MNMCASKNNSGFSLIEILVSLIVLSVGLMGLGGLQLAALKGSNDAHYRTQASLLMMDLADRMRANQDGVANDKYRTSAMINCSDSPTKQCDTKNCSGEELAQFDLYTITCGIKKSLPDGKLSVDCLPSTDCMATGLNTNMQLNKTHTIGISWNETKRSIEDFSDGKQYKLRNINLKIIP